MSIDQCEHTLFDFCPCRRSEDDLVIDADDTSQVSERLDEFRLDTVLAGRRRRERLTQQSSFIGPRSVLLLLGQLDPMLGQTQHIVVLDHRAGLSEPVDKEFEETGREPEATPCHFAWKPAPKRIACMIVAEKIE
jgi:hypothetical protein